MILTRLCGFDLGLGGSRVDEARSGASDVGEATEGAVNRALSAVGVGVQASAHAGSAEDVVVLAGGDAGGSEGKSDDGEELHFDGVCWLVKKGVLER